MIYKLKIISDGEPDYELETEIIAVLAKSGYEIISSGYDFRTKKRDINFESPNKFVRSEG